MSTIVQLRLIASKPGKWMQSLEGSSGLSQTCINDGASDMDVQTALVDYLKHDVAIWTKAGTHCDKETAIELAEKLDHECTIVRTFSGAKPDSVFTRQSRGWVRVQ